MPLSIPGGVVPTTFAAPQGTVYFMSFAPNGTQVLMPVASAGIPVSQAGLPTAWNTSTAAHVATPTNQQQSVGSLEARAAALSAHAAEVRAAARRAKTAALAARRQRGEPDFLDFEQAMSSEVVPMPVSMSRTATDDRTTLMLRNLPNNYTRSAVLDMLDSEGFAGTYCFVYVPTDFKNFTGFGYAFVGFCAHDAAAHAKRHYQGFNKWRVPSQKSCDVAWSGPVQGLEQHTERYRNSPVMHPGVPDEYKPAVFVNGVRVPFPAPTKRLRPPRLRHSIAGEVLAPGFAGEVQNAAKWPGRST